MEPGGRIMFEGMLTMFQNTANYCIQTTVVAINNQIGEEQDLGLTLLSVHNSNITIEKLIWNLISCRSALKIGFSKTTRPIQMKTDKK